MALVKVFYGIRYGVEWTNIILTAAADLRIRESMGVELPKSGLEKAHFTD
jgi:hypothetical protein